MFQLYDHEPVGSTPFGLSRATCKMQALRDWSSPQKEDLLGGPSLSFVKGWLARTEFYSEATKRKGIIIWSQREGCFQVTGKAFPLICSKTDQKRGQKGHFIHHVLSGEEKEKLNLIKQGIRFFLSLGPCQDDLRE